MMGNPISGKSDSGGTAGVSNFDQFLLAQQLGLSNQAIANRYAQLGEEAVPSTMQQQDLSGQLQATQAALGQEQTNNLSNPSAPGSPANLGSIAAQNARLASAIGQFGGGGSTGNFGSGGSTNPPPQSNVTNVG